MMELTKKQYKAVYERNTNILVSAAAGSGKTSVLTERIAKLCEEGADIRRMLVCTFTNAAAAEMRSRISKKLLVCAEEANDARLRTQAEYASAADICTFHSFCIRMLKEHFLEAGLRQRWHVASDKISAQLMDQALEDTFDELSEAGSEELRMLQLRYTGSNETTLKSTLLSLYAFTCSLPEQLEWIVRMDRAASVEHCRELYRKKYRLTAERMLEAYAECVKISTDQIWEKQLANDKKEQDTATAMKDALEREDFALLADLLKLRAPMKDRKMPAGEAKEKHAFFLNLARDERDKLKEISPDDLKRLEREGEYLSTQADALYRVLSVFSEKYRMLKDAQGLLDYDDIMSVSYRLLQDESIAREYRDYYDYVFVDEYQDTNPIQEALIAKIVREDNAFMVGDIKQSIYRFRLADPLIFRERQQRYDNAEENGELLIRMNDNFRSAPEVIDGINRAMGQLMSRDFGEIDYTEDEALIAGRTDLSGETEFLLTVREDRSPTAAEEAENIARRIAELHAEGVAYKDIAVLMRATKGDGDLFAQIFQQRGIPCVNNAERSVPGEVELFLNLLRIVDNANADIPLIAVMRSHLGGFDEQDLAEIRAGSLHGSYYDAVKLTAEAETELGQRCAEFLEQIKLLRIYARSMRLKDFLILLKERTSFEERLILLPHGMEKADVFRRFYEDCLANAEEKESLYHLLMYYEAILKRGESLVGKKETLGDNDCVQIMTVHKSKGLEFPVVFFARLGKRLRKDDAQNIIIYTSELGVVSDIYDESTRIRRRSLMRSVMSDLIEDQLRSEALRVVYVAMTRAKERLILSGAVRKDKLDELTQQCIAAKRYGQLRALQTPLQWLIAAYSDEAFLDWEYLRVTEHIDACEAQSEAVAMTVAEVFDGCGCAEEKPLALYQPDESPLKYGVSALMPEYNFETSSAPQPTNAQSMGGTEFGSLVHYFMEHANFEDFEGVENQLGRMLASQLITEAEAQLLRKFSAQIEAFFKGETAERIRRSPQVYREVPFNLSVSAKSVGKDAEGDVILQGIIDLLFEENGKWVIVDYKSNFVTEENIGELIAHYRVQMQLYRRAAEMISRRSVDECILCFLRAGREESITF